MNQIYSLRKNFTVIGLTGPMGSGCSKVAEFLSREKDKFFDNNQVRNPKDINIKDAEGNVIYNNILFQRKFNICYNYTKNNWDKYIFIDYKKVILFYVLDYFINVKKCNDIKEELTNLIISNFKKSMSDENFDDSKMLINKKELNKIFTKSNVKINDLVDEIKSIKNTGGLLKIKTPKKLKSLHNVFFLPSSHFNKLCIKLIKLFTEKNYYLRTLFFHQIACNIRTSGKPNTKGTKNCMDFVYNNAMLINRLIKAYKTYSEDSGTCQIVINSLKNSLEIMYFKERYSAFYMIAVHSDENRNTVFNSIVKSNLEKSRTVERLVDLDNTEYKTNDFRVGIFSSPDIENCIQKSDIHLIHKKHSENADKNSIPDFYSIHEQLIKYLALIQQPGIITPNNIERCMQMAFNSKLNSGCISRQVGAVVTDEGYAVKSVGWNDTPKKTIPCILRNVQEVMPGSTLLYNDSTYSKFELPASDFKYKINSNKHDSKGKPKNVEFVDKNFSANVKALYSESKLKAITSDGKNCSYCFKTLHNKFEGEDNQVHTRSLHAEENAMLQISKFGGQGLKNGFLFTTASPCELCSKKAYQLGIKKVYYIDKYPGISKEHIIGVGFDAPELIQFNGVVGRSFNKLYEPFLAYKDELSLYK